MIFFVVGLVDDVESHRDAQLLSACLNGTDSSTNSSLLYLHSNNMNTFKSLFLKKSYSYKYNCYKTNKVWCVFG